LGIILFGAIKESKLKNEGAGRGKDARRELNVRGKLKGITEGKKKRSTGGHRDVQRAWKFTIRASRELGGEKTLRGSNQKKDEKRGKTVKNKKKEDRRAWTCSGPRKKKDREGEKKDSI